MALLSLFLLACSYPPSPDSAALHLAGAGVIGEGEGGEVAPHMTWCNGVFACRATARTGWQGHA